MPSNELPESRGLQVNNTEAKSKKRRVLVTAAVAILAVPAVIALGTAVWQDRKIYIVSMLIILLSMVPFAVLFERRRPAARELAVLAVMIAIGVAGRAAFYMVPQFKPIAAIVIICGVAFGCESGFIAGAMSAFLSNFIFGQGPWTPYQMEALGILGFLAGLLFYRRDGRLPNRWLLCVYGFIAAFFVYGLIADTSTLLTTYSSISWEAIVSVYSAGILFNLIHAAATFVFLLILAKPLLGKLNRIRVKYGLYE